VFSVSLFPIGLQTDINPIRGRTHKSVVSVTSGWLFDAYPLGNKMIFWIRQVNGNTIRLEDSRWGHSIYVASYISNYTDLLRSIKDDRLIKEYQVISCYERIIDTTQAKIIRLYPQPEIDGVFRV
jgi:hypothetical protein